MGFFGLGRRSTTTIAAPAAKPAARPGADKASLAETALRGADAQARSAALDRLLADPAANAAQLSIVAVQDPEGSAGARAAAAVPERRLLKDIQRKAKSAAARAAAVKAIAALDAAASRPSEEKARTARLTALEALLPRATKLAVGDGSGAEAAWSALAGERAAALAKAEPVAIDPAAQAVLDRLAALGLEIRARIAEAATRASAEAQRQAEAEAQAATAATQRGVAEAEAAARRSAPAPQGLPEIVARAEELVAGDPEAAADEFLRLHKDWLRLVDGLDQQHDLRLRFLAAWDANRAARKQVRAERGERRAESQAALAACVAQAQALAAAADAIAPDAGEALGAHQQALDALRVRFREAAYRVPPGEARLARETFQAALDDAYAPLRAAREAADAEAFTNLVRAEQLAEEVAALPVATDPAEAFRGLKDCQARWRKLGPLPRIKARAAWESFRAAGDACFASLKPWLAAQDQERAAAMARREELCVQAEAVVSAPAVGLPGSPAERDGRRAGAVRMRELQSAWRETGEVPRGMDRALWERFKKAQDAFWERHKADLDAARERAENAAAEREEVVARCEAFAADAEKAMAAKSGVLTAADVQRRVYQFRDAWRAGPPVPRELRSGLDQRFDAAIDRILATIRGKLDAERAQLEAAAAKRRAMCGELEEILAGENPRWQSDAVERIRKAWRETGRVPAEERESLERRFTDLLGRWRTLAGA